MYRYVEYFELKTIDARYKVRNSLVEPQPLDNRIVHINIDDYSRIQSGYTLWHRTYYADLIRKVAEANADVIMLDIIFASKFDTLGNSSLFRSIADAGNVISPIILKFGDKNQQFRWLTDAGFNFDLHPDIQSGLLIHATDLLYSPMERIANQSDEMGFVNIKTDPDGIIRKTPIAVEADGKLVLSVGFQALCSFLDYDLENIEIVGRKLILREFPQGENFENIVVPLDKSKNLLINFIAPVGEKYKQYYPNSHSAWNLICTPEREDFSGKLVIISDISSVGHDFSATPLDQKMANPYIISTTIHSILNNDFLHQFSHKFLYMLILVFAVILILLCYILDTFRFSIAFLIFAAMYVVVAFSVFAYLNWIFPILPVIIPLTGVYFFSSVYKHSHLERYKGVLEGSLTSYLSPVLMEKIKANPEMLAIGGKRKRITVLFSDIADFTKFCDQAEPEEIQDVLSKYFKEAATIIFNNRGIVDKYLGDGILAFFENENEDLTNPQNAVLSAMQIQKKAIQLNDFFTLRNRFPFAIRIGIATGWAMVGNIGPEEKIDYTIIGSVVNLASRLQSLGEKGDILIDEDTLFFTEDQYLSEALGEQSVKGFSKKIKIFRVKSN